MFSRPSFSIRRLIPQRKPDGPEAKAGLHPPGDHETARSRTWPVGNRKGPIPTIDLRRSEDSHRIIVLPPLPDTPTSWTGSYHDFCNDTSFTSPRCSPTPPSSSRNFSPQRSPSQTPRTSPQTSPQKSPLLTPRQYDDSPRSRSSSSASATPSQFQLPTAPSPLPPQQQEDGWPLPSLVSPRDLLGHMDDGVRTQWLSDDEGPSQRSRHENAQQTARADDAFHKNGSRLGVNLLSPLGFSPSSDTSTRSAAAKRASLARRTSQRTSQSSSKSGRSATTKVPLKTFSAAPKRLSSVARTKKQRQKKTRRRPRVDVAGPKWTFTEGAKDLFAIRIFNRVEADEMLPESVLREIRMSRATQARLAKRAGGIDTDSDTSPIELDGILFNEPPSPTIPVVQHLLLPKTEDDDTTPRPSPTLRPHQNLITTAEDRETMKFKAFFRGHGQHREVQAPSHPPPLPPKNPHRRPLLQQSPPLRPPPPLLPPPLFRPSTPLCTIPETAPDPTKLFLPPIPRRSPPRTRRPGPPGPPAGLIPRSPADAARLAKLQSLYIILPSTPHTPRLTHAHAPIFLARADLFRTKLAQAGSGGESTIDKAELAEYQAAILGGSGDFLDEVVDYTRPSEADEAEREDAVRWFSEFGFDGPGALVGEGDVKAAKALVKGVEAPPPPYCASRVPPAEGREMEMQEVGGQIGFKECYLQRRGVGLRVNPTNATSPAAAAGGGSSLWRASAASLPQSPMLDIVVGQDAGGNEYVVPPMGFNLQHDIGDFLKWEADNVFAPGYYGTSLA